MRKHFLKLLMLCAATSALTGCGNDKTSRSGGSSGGTTVAVTGITLSEYSCSIEAGSSHTIYATVTPTDATNKDVTWSSSNALIATVSGGTIYAKSKVNGDCTITAKTSDGHYTATCSVRVYRAID